MFEQQTVKRWEAQRVRDTVASDAAGKVGDVLLDAGRRQHERATLAQGPEDTDERAIESERRQKEKAFDGVGVEIESSGGRMK